MLFCGVAGVLMCGVVLLWLTCCCFLPFFFRVVVCLGRCGGVGVVWWCVGGVLC